MNDKAKTNKTEQGWFAALTVLTLIVLGVWLWALFYFQSAQRDAIGEIDSWGVFGDSFGVVTSFFSGLGCLGVGWGLWFQLRALDRSLQAQWASIELTLKEQHRDRQIEMSLKIQDQFFSDGFVSIRKQVSKIREYWNGNVFTWEVVASYCLGVFDPGDDAEMPSWFWLNDLEEVEDLLSNLPRFLNYWHVFETLESEKETDPALTDLIHHEFRAWVPFLEKLLSQIKTESGGVSQLPPWFATVQNLISKSGCGKHPPV